MVSVALLAALLVAHAADLPPGAILRLGDTRFRAGAPVRHLRFSDDGRTLHGWVSGPMGKLKPVAWDAATGLPVPPPADLVPPDLPHNTVQAVDLGGNRVLTAGPGNVARVWDAQDHREVVRFHGHTRQVTAVAVFAAGKRLATGDVVGFVHVWDTNVLRPVVEPVGHTAPVRAVRVSADGLRAVTTSDDGTARVWDLITGRQLRVFATDGPVELDARGTSVVVLTNGVPIVHDVVTGLEVVADERPTPPAADPSDWLARLGLAVSPDGRTVAVGSSLHEATTGEVRRTLVGNQRLLGFTPDGSRLLTTGADHTVLVWDVRLQALPLPDALKRETNAAKLWARMCEGKADAAYLAMARLAAEPPAAVKMARLRLKPAARGDTETRLADSRAIELLESLDTPEAWAFLEELTTGDRTAWRTQEAARALVRRIGFQPVRLP